MNQVAPAQPFPSGFHSPPQQYYYGSGPAHTASTQSSQPANRQAFAPTPQSHAGFQQDGARVTQAPMASMPPMMPSQFGQQLPYTTAPLSQSLSAQAPPLPSVQASQQQQQQQPTLQNVRQSSSASPHPRQSPYAGFQQLPQQQTYPEPTPSNKYPMVAPPLPQSPANAQQASGSNASPAPGTPQSPGSQAREQRRVALLLEINTLLLQEVHKLQAEGKGGVMNPQQLAQMKSEGKHAELASDEYVQVLRRVQANLAYLMPKAQNEQQKTPQGPAHMTPPQHMPQLQSKYDQLSELLAGWQGYDRRSSAGDSGSPQPNGGMVAASASAVGTPA